MKIRVAPNPQRSRTFEGKQSLSVAFAMRESAKIRVVAALRIEPGSLKWPIDPGAIGIDARFLPLL